MIEIIFMTDVEIPPFAKPIPLRTLYTRGCTRVCVTIEQRVKCVISMAKYALNVRFVINADRLRERCTVFDRLVIMTVRCRWICMKSREKKRRKSGKPYANDIAIATLSTVSFESTGHLTRKLEIG